MKKSVTTDEVFERHPELHDVIAQKLAEFNLDPSKDGYREFKCIVPLLAGIAIYPLRIVFVRPAIGEPFVFSRIEGEGIVDGPDVLDAEIIE